MDATEVTDTDLRAKALAVGLDWQQVRHLHATVNDSPIGEHPAKSLQLAGIDYTVGEPMALHFCRRLPDWAIETREIFIGIDEVRYYDVYKPADWSLIADLVPAVDSKAWH